MNNISDVTGLTPSQSYDLLMIFNQLESIRKTIERIDLKLSADWLNPIKPVDTHVIKSTN